MKTTTFTLASLVSSIPWATATFDWKDATKFTCPANTDNTCDDVQQEGFNWAGLNLGSFQSFGGFDFSGFTCDSSFGGAVKRDAITGRTFQDKCIRGKATADKASAASFGCGSSLSVAAFSVKEFQVSVEFDCDLEFHYDMPDGSLCKQRQACRKSGTTVKNTQCGGATNVVVLLPPGGEGSKQKTSCDVGFHSIAFDCGTASSSRPVPSSTTTSTYATAPATPPASSTPSVSVPASASSQSNNVTPPFPANSTVPAASSPAVSTTSPVLLTTSTIFETQVSTIISCASTVQDCPAASTVLTTVTTAVSTTICPVSTEIATAPVEGSPTEAPAIETTLVTSSETPPATEAPVSSVDVTTIIIRTSTTLCPVTTTHTSGGVTSIETGLSTSTVFLTETSTVCTRCTAELAPSSSVEVGSGPPTSEPPPPPAVTAPCPDVLPRCLNTWLFTSGCASNTDVSCYCPSADFVSAIFGCLSAYSVSDAEVGEAQRYLQGICAAHVPENPAIVTGATTIRLSSAPVTTPAASPVPLTTVQILTTIVVPCTETEGPSVGATIPSSSTTTVLSTALTVPQVVFQTITGSSTAAVSLVQGTFPPTAVAGITTPTSTTLASVPVAAPSNGSIATPGSPLGFTGVGSSYRVSAGSLALAAMIVMIAI